MDCSERSKVFHLLVKIKIWRLKFNQVSTTAEKNFRREKYISIVRAIAKIIL